MLLEKSEQFDARVLKEARSLAQSGLNLKLLALRDEGVEPDSNEYGYRTERLTVRSRILRGRPFLVLKAMEFTFRLLRGAVAARARVYHAHHPMTLFSAVVAAKLRGAHVVYDCHELHFALPDQGRIKSTLMRLYERSLLPFVDNVIMSDGDFRSDIFRRRHKYRKQIHHIYNCVIMASADESKKDLRAVLGVPPTHKLVVYTGIVGNHRGLEVAIESMPMWPDDAHFVMIGNRTEAEELRLGALAKNNGVNDRVHFWGPVPPDDVAKWTTTADLALVLIENISLSYYGSTPTKMFEAIMARVPQISSNFPEIRRIVMENSVGPVGKTVDPSDAKAVGRCVSEILANETECKSYRENADVLARTVYNWEAQERVLLAMYGDMLETDLRSA